MAKNSIDVYGAKGKGNTLDFDPDDLTLVTDRSRPLYDERVHLPVSESMVLNIMFQGVLQPIEVSKNPETGDIEVVTGHQRVKAAREANRRLREQGRVLRLVPARPSIEGLGAFPCAVGSNGERKRDSTAGNANDDGGEDGALGEHGARRRRHCNQFRLQRRNGAFNARVSRLLRSGTESGGQRRHARDAFARTGEGVAGRAAGEGSGSERGSGR